MSPVIPKINKNPIITIPTYWIIIWTLGGISFLVIQLISENRIKLPSSNGIGSKFINPSDIEIKEIKEYEKIIDKIMEILEIQHNQIEESRSK